MHEFRLRTRDVRTETLEDVSSKNAARQGLSDAAMTLACKVAIKKESESNWTQSVKCEL